MHVAYDTSPKNDGGTSTAFRIGLINPLEMRDPRCGINFANMSIIWTLYEPVYRSTSPGQVEDIMLEYPLREEPSSGELPVYSGAVKPGIRFTDGTEVTAQHIAESLNKTVSFAAQAMTTARGDRVFFQLKRRNANFQFVLARHDHPIILERGAEFLGTGPYMLGPGATPEHFHLLRNPFYYRNFPGPSEIECRVYPLDASGRRDRLMEAVNHGQVDFTEDLLREQIAQTQHMRRIIDLGFCTAILYFNTQRSIFADASLRRAVAAAIDRRALAEQSYSNPLAFTATGVVPPSLGTYSDGIRFDLARAREMFASANVGSASRSLVMWVVPVPRPHLPNPYATAQLLARQISELGLTIEIKQARNVNQFYEITSRGGYDLLLSGWIPDTSDPLDIMETLFTSDCIPAPSDATRGSNFARWSNAAFDEAVNLHRTAPTPQSWGKICQLLSDQVPAFPLMYGPHMGVVSWRVKKFPRDFGFRPFLAEIEL
jgi:peptide/nickel transport system substrate-binding protein